MIPKQTLFAAVVFLLPATAPAQDNSDEEVVLLSPFSVSSEDDRGYQAASTLAGSRVRTDLRDVGGSVSVVSKEFLQDTRAAMPEVPVTVVKKADALLIQFAISATASKADARNAELNAMIASIAKSVEAVPGLRLEPREVYLAGADRKRTIIGKGDVVTSFAHFVIFADIGGDVRPFQRVKQVRDLLSSLKIDSPTMKLFDGPVGLYVRRPSQYRAELLAKIFQDVDAIKKGLGPEFEVLVSGLSGAVKLRTCSETEIELWIDYSFTIRSVRELEAKKK